MMESIDYFKQYAAHISTALASVDDNQITAVQNILIEAAKSGSSVFVCGNGGSAAIAEHFTCDHSKGVKSNTKFNPRYYSLTSNVSLLTAYGNDYGFDTVFSGQLESLAKPGDILITVSSSGNSPNIVKAIRYANQNNITTISFTGFDGGTSRHAANHNVHVPYFNYGVVEDCHQIIMHSLAQYIRTTYTEVDLKEVRL